MQRRDFSWDCADCGFNGQLQQGFTIGGMGPDCHFARQQSLGPNVRFGSEADISHRPINVRFALKSELRGTGVTITTLCLAQLLANLPRSLICKALQYSKDRRRL